MLISEPRVSISTHNHYAIPAGILSAEFEGQSSDVLAQLGVPTSKSDYTALTASKSSSPLIYPGANGMLTQTYHLVRMTEVCIFYFIFFYWREEVFGDT